MPGAGVGSAPVLRACFGEEVKAEVEERFTKGVDGQIRWRVGFPRVLLSMVAVVALKAGEAGWGRLQRGETVQGAPSTVTGIDARMRRREGRLGAGDERVFVFRSAAHPAAQPSGCKGEFQSARRRVVGERSRERSMSQIVRREVRLRWFDGSMGGYCRVRHSQMVSLSPGKVPRIVLGG